MLTYYAGQCTQWLEDEDVEKMDEDDEVTIPPEILEDLRAAGWKSGSSSLDLVLAQEAETSATRAREAFQSGKRRSEWGATASAILCASAA